MVSLMVLKLHQMKKETIEILTDDKGDVLKTKKGQIEG